MRRFQSGMTLIEIAVVLLILSVIATILFPRLPRLSESRKNTSLRRLAASVQVLHEEAAFKKKA